MAQRPDVVVIGGGVIGCSIAFFLAKAGASVTVLERGHLGAEASTAGSGGVGYVPGTGPYSQLGKMSLKLFQTLSGELLELGGVDMEFANCGQLAVALDEAEANELRQVIDEYQRLGEDVRWLEPQEAFDIEPLLNPSIIGAMHRPGVSRVNNQRLSGAYARAGMQMGAEFRESTEVIGLARTGKRVTGAKTYGEEIESGQVVIAAGAWSGLVAGCLDMAEPSPAPDQSEATASSVPVWPVRGQNLNLQPAAGGLRTIVYGSWGVLVPRNDGSVVAGVTVEEVGFDSRTTVEGVSSILELATRIVPSFGNATLNWAIAGLRPGSPDEIPVMGALPGWEGVSVASGHYRDGITMSAVTGKLMADHLTGSEPELLATFSPSRFQVS